MGNANGHIERGQRNSGGGGAGYVSSSLMTGDINPHIAHRDACLTSPIYQPGGGTVGPVDITKGTSPSTGKSPSKILTSGSAFSKTVRGFRPRALTADSDSYNRPRPRAVTVSHGPSNGSSRARGVGPRRHASVDEENISPSNISPSDSQFTSHKMDAATAAFIASCKDKEGATKKLPTIFK